MNTDVIDKAFHQLIHQPGIHHQLGVTSRSIIMHRYRLRHGQRVSTDTKIRLLQKSGWTQPQNLYTRADMTDLLKFYRRTSAATKSLGVEYALEKWESMKR